MLTLPEIEGYWEAGAVPGVFIHSARRERMATGARAFIFTV